MGRCPDVSAVLGVPYVIIVYLWGETHCASPCPDSFEVSACFVVSRASGRKRSSDSVVSMTVLAEIQSLDAFVPAKPGPEILDR